MNNLEIFNNEEFGEVRTTIINEEVYFVGKDIVNILQYQNGSRDINRHVDEEDREKVMIFDGNQNKETIVINESGLYSLILRSKLPTAKKFKRWVTSEVLPSIRKNGMYMTNNVVDKILEDPEEFAKIVNAYAEEHKKRKEAELVIKHQKNEITEKDHIIEVQQPKAEFYDFAMDKESTYTATEIAKSLGFRSAAELNMFLKRKGVQYKKGEQWLLKAEYADKGYKKIRAYKNCDRGHQVWTLKGYEFVKNLYEEQIAKYRKGGIEKNV